MSERKIEQSFPNLQRCGYSVTSPATLDYNCIAWAANDTEAWWEPDPLDLSYWPLGIPRSYTLDAYIGHAKHSVTLFVKMLKMKIILKK